MSAQKRKSSAKQDFQSPKVKTPKIEAIFPTPGKTPKNKKSPFQKNTPKNSEQQIATFEGTPFNKKTPKQAGSPKHNFEKLNNKTPNSKTPQSKSFNKQQGAANTPGGKKSFNQKSPQQAGTPQPKLEMFSGTTKLKLNSTNDAPRTEKEKIKAAAEKLHNEKKDNRHTRRRGQSKEKRMAKRAQFNDLKRQALQGDEEAKSKIQERITKMEAEVPLTKNKKRKLNTLKRIVNFDPTKKAEKPQQKKVQNQNAAKKQNQKAKQTKQASKQVIVNKQLSDEDDDEEEDEFEGEEENADEASDSEDESAEAEDIEMAGDDDEEDDDEESENSELEEGSDEEEQEGSVEDQEGSAEEDQEDSEEGSDDEGEEDDDSSENDNINNKKPVQQNKNQQQNKNHQPKKQNQVQNKQSGPVASPGSAPFNKKTRYVVFVGNIPYTTTADNLRSHFNKVGEIVDVRLPQHPDGKSRGIAYVEVKDDSAYQKALSMHNSFLGGRKINVLYTEGGKKKTDQQKADIKAKNSKFQAMRKQGQLQGSENYNQKRSVRRANKKQKGGE